MIVAKAVTLDEEKGLRRTQSDLQNFSAAVRAIAKVLDKDEDILVMTSHGSGRFLQQNRHKADLPACPLFGRYQRKSRH